MSVTCLTWLSSLYLFIQFNQVADCYPNPDLSNLHYFDESFDLIQEESRLQPTAISPPPAEFVIREKIPFVSLFDEEAQTEPSYLRPVAIKKQTIIEVEPLKKPVNYKVSAVVAQAEKQREFTTAKPPSPPPPVTRTHPQPRRDEDSTQAYGVLENAALSLQDDDQLAIHNLSSNCSTIDTQVDLPEKPILKPHELEEGVIAEAKLDAVASVENQRVFSSRETNTVLVNPEFLGEFGQGSEVQLVVEEPVNVTLAKQEPNECNETASLPELAVAGDASSGTSSSTKAATASQAESSNVAEETTSPSSSEVSTPTDATLLESTDVSPPSADQVQISSLPSTSEKSSLATPSPTEPILNVEETAAAPSVSSSSTVLETSPSASDEAALLPQLPIQQDVPRPNEETETAEQTAVIETTAPSVGNSSIILLEESAADNANGASEETGSYEDGQVVGASMLKHGASYNIKSLAEGLCLTAHKHRFLDAGVLPGSVTTETFEREDNQIWDALETAPNEYWLMTQRYTVNEVTSVLTDHPLVPLKNFFTLVPITITTFIMKSTVFDKCIESVGMHKRISFVPCDVTVIEQQWTAEYLYEEQKANLK